MISVLYVDDEEPLLMLTKRYLETKGDFAVDTAESGKLALQKLKNADYDAVVSDYQMPGMDGIEFLSLLRKEYPHLPFIIFTGKGREEVVIEAFEKGADFYLQKGGEPKPQFAELMHKIQSAVSQRHDEMALRESESRFRNLFNNMSSGVAIYEPVDDDSDFIFRDINHAAETIEQVRKEEIIGQSVLAVFPGIKEFGLFEVFQRVARTGTAELHPVSIYKDNRISGWRENFVYRLPSGEIVAIYEDVTEKKQAEKAFSAAQVWLGIALRAAHAGTWDWDVPTGTLTWSPEFFELFGLPPGAPPSFETWLATLHPDDRDQAMAKINQSVKEHSFLWNEYRIILPGDVVRWIGAGGSATYNEAGEPLRMSGVCIDITDRKKAEVSLQESEEKFRAVLENIPDMVLVHREGNIIYVNPALTEAMGSTPDEVLNTSIFDYIAPEYIEYVSESLRKRTTTGPAGPNEIEIISKTGERRNVIVRPTVIEFGGSPAILTVLTDITERKRAEQSLREASLRWQSTFDSTRDAICIVDPDQRIVISNRMMQEMVGAKNGDELAGRHCFEVVHGTTEPVPGCPFIKMLHSRQRERMEMKIGDRWIVFTTDPILDGTQALVGAVHNIRDITYRKQAEEALVESRLHYKQLVENINDVIFTIDLNGIITYISPVIYRLYGYTPDEVIHEHFARFVHPDDLPQVSDAFTRRVEGEYGENVFRIIARDGRERYVSTKQTPIMTDGKITGFNYIMADITDRWQMEITLSESEKRYRTLFEDSPVSLWEEDFSGIKSWIDSKKAEGITDFDAYFDDHPKDLVSITRMVKVNKINATTMTMVGAESEEQFYTGLGLVFTEKSYSTFKDEIVSFVSGTPRYEGISVIGTLNGDERDILIRCSVVPGYETTWGKVLISIIDITDRIAAEEALHQSNKKLNLLSSITRHDILNGVAVLQGYIELAGDEVRSPGMQEYLGHMNQAAKTIRHQIEFTKEYQEIGVKDATWQNVRETVMKTASIFKMEGVTLTINCENSEIFADPLLRKVFYNLFDNAFRYAPPFTTITVSCDETEGGMAVVFADDGVGISAENRKHLFEHGFGNHTGLGLFLSREILAITGITITENGKPGKGARFEMTVPKGKFRFSGISSDSNNSKSRTTV